MKPGQAKTGSTDAPAEPWPAGDQAQAVTSAARFRHSVEAQLGLLAAIATGGLAIATRGGIIVRQGDPIAYISTARSLASGHGASLQYSGILPTVASKPEVHWPPGYTLLLSLGGHSILGWARTLNCLLFAANVFLLGYLAHRLGIRRAGVLLIAVVFAGASFDLHATVRSEPLFLLLALLGLHGLVGFMAKPTRWLLPASALAFGLATLTRYAGEAFVLAAALCALAFFDRPRRERLASAGTFLVLGNLPVLIWLFSAQHSPRTFGFHPPGSSELNLAMSSISGYVVPSGLATPIRALLCIAFLAIVVVVTGADFASKRERTLDYLLLLFAGIYLVFIVASQAFFDRAIPFDTRLLMPAYVLLLLWFARNWPRSLTWSRSGRRSGLALVGVAGVLSVFLASGWAAFDTARHAQSESYSSPSWRATKLVKTLAPLPRSVIVYSNRPDVIYFLMDRPVHLLPPTIANPHYASQMRAIQAGTCGRATTIVYSTSRAATFSEPSLATVAHAFRIADISSSRGWEILTLDTSPPC